MPTTSSIAGSSPRPSGVSLRDAETSTPTPPQAPTPATTFPEGARGSLRRRRPAPEQPPAALATETQPLLQPAPDDAAAPANRPRDAPPRRVLAGARSALDSVRGLFGNPGLQAPAPDLALQAALRGDAGQLQTLLQKDPSLLTATFAGGESLLTWAAWAGQPDAVLVMLHHARSAPDLDFAQIVNHRNAAGRTALAQASARNHPGLARSLLLHEETDINRADADGRTPLHLAAVHGNAQVAHVLLNRPAPVAERHEDDGAPDDPSRAAADRSRATAFEIQPSLPDQHRDTALHLAIRYGHSDVATRIAGHPQALPDLVNRAGATALEMAIDHGDLAVLQALVKHANADPNRPGRHGLPPIWRALKRWQANPLYSETQLSGAGQLLCALAASSRVESNSQGLDGETPLTYVCRQEPNWVVAELRFHVAWQATTLQALLEAGRQGGRMSLEACNRAGKTPLEVAQEANRPALVSLLVQARREGGMASPPPGQPASAPHG
jgi:ankyrin repeat protein